jgi:hypothetical protein
MRQVYGLEVVVEDKLCGERLTRYSINTMLLVGGKIKGGLYSRAVLLNMRKGYIISRNQKL